MILLLSPAKTIRKDIIPTKTTTPTFTKETNDLLAELKKYKPSQLSELMAISEKLGELNYTRYQNFNRDAQAAIFAFMGDVYETLHADKFSKADLEYADKHLRILSGLYGILKPLDLTNPYRLEMGTGFKTKAGSNLYEFWGDKIKDNIITDLNSQNSRFVINLASNEYAKAAKLNNLGFPVYNIHFKETKDGAHKTIGIFTKKARGAMANYILTNRLHKIADIKGFANLGCNFRPELSSEFDLVFVNSTH